MGVKSAPVTQRDTVGFPNAQKVSLAISRQTAPGAVARRGARMKKAPHSRAGPFETFLQKDRYSAAFKLSPSAVSALISSGRGMETTW